MLSNSHVVCPSNCSQAQKHTLRRLELLSIKQSLTVLTFLSPCMRVGVPGVRMASCGASPNATSGNGAASIGTTKAFFKSRSTTWKNCRRNTPWGTKSGDFGFVHKNKWIHQNHCFPNPHNDLHVALKPTPNNNKRENRYVGIHITISFFAPNLRICWARTKNHYVGLIFSKRRFNNFNSSKNSIPHNDL